MVTKVKTSDKINIFVFFKICFCGCGVYADRRSFLEKVISTYYIYGGIRERGMPRAGLEGYNELVRRYEGRMDYQKPTDCLKLE